MKSVIRVTHHSSHAFQSIYLGHNVILRVHAKLPGLRDNHIRRVLEEFSGLPRYSILRDLFFVISYLTLVSQVTRGFPSLKVAFHFFYYVTLYLSSPLLSLLSAHFITELHFPVSCTCNTLSLSKRMDHQLIYITCFTCFLHETNLQPGYPILHV
jgi:hypothetical protein